MRFKIFIENRDVEQAWSSFNDLAARGRLDSGEMGILADRLDDFAETEDDLRTAEIIREMGRLNIYPGILGSNREMGWSNIDLITSRQQGPKRTRFEDAYFDVPPWALKHSVINDIANMPGARPQRIFNISDVFFTTAQEAVMAIVNYIKRGRELKSIIPEPLPPEQRSDRALQFDEIDFENNILYPMRSLFGNIEALLSNNSNVGPNAVSRYADRIYNLNVNLKYPGFLTALRLVVVNVKEFIDLAKIVLRKIQETLSRVNRNNLSYEQADLWREISKLEKNLVNLLELSKRNFVK